MMKFTVYILKCSDKSYYTGVTNSLYRRMDEHINGRNPTCYTFNRRPLELMFEIDFHHINQAIACEKQIKGWTRKKKEALISGDMDLLKVLSQCTNDSHFSNRDNDNIFG